MIIIFCTNGLSRIPDPEYNNEIITVDKLGIEYLLFDFESFMEDDDRAFRYIDKRPKIESAIYRGWMLSPKKYEKLFIELLNRNIVLINSPYEYERAHCLFSSYDTIKSMTPKSTFILKDDFNDEVLKEALFPFHNSPVFFRDFYKSEKLLWESAAFIPDGKDLDKVKQTIDEFKKYRTIKGGYVFREFIPLKTIGKHPISKIPISNEWRIYFLNEKIIDISPYWEEGNYNNSTKPSTEKFIEVGRNIDSSFFTMDVAETHGGEWIIIEIGDGQVSGLTKHCNHEDFFKALTKGV